MLHFLMFFVTLSNVALCKCSTILCSTILILYHLISYHALFSCCFFDIALFNISPKLHYLRLHYFHVLIFHSALAFAALVVIAIVFWVSVVATFRSQTEGSTIFHWTYSHEIYYGGFTLKQEIQVSKNFWLWRFLPKSPWILWKTKTKNLD